MKLTPLADRVVLKMMEAEETTKGGIILTASAKEKPSVAEVISVGVRPPLESLPAGWGFSRGACPQKRIWTSGECFVNDADGFRLSENWR